MCSHNTLDTDQNKSKVQFLNVLYQIASSEILLLTFQITLHLAMPNTCSFNTISRLGLLPN